jgi:hypothetical protein
LNEQSQQQIESIENPMKNWFLKFKNLRFVLELNNVSTKDIFEYEIHTHLDHNKYT